MEAQRKWDTSICPHLLLDRDDGLRDRQLADRCGIPFVMVRNGRVIPHK